MLFIVFQLSIHFSNNIEGREKPYLHFRLSNVYLEAALMEYGPVLQFGIGSILLADKTDTSLTGSYLEFLSSNDTDEEILAISYRKVRSNCPDFKSHFRNIERSLSINISKLKLLFDRDAYDNLRIYGEEMLK